MWARKNRNLTPSIGKKGIKNHAPRIKSLATRRSNRKTEWENGLEWDARNISQLWELLGIDP
jgi:ribosomal protein S30